MLRPALQIALIALLVALTACAPGPVTPLPGNPAATTATRPRGIDISGVLPCDLLTEDQRAELQLDGAPRPSSGTDALFGQARSCSISRLDASPALSVSITLVVEHGIERFSEPGITEGVRPIEIDGYPAVVSPPRPSMPTNCLAAVDVSAGQMVGVLLSDSGTDPVIPVDELCRDVSRYAQAVMSTLTTR